MTPGVLISQLDHRHLGPFRPGPGDRILPSQDGGGHQGHGEPDRERLDDGNRFAIVGIRLGLTLTRTKEVLVVREVPVPAQSTFVRDDPKVAELGITPRELEILEHIAAGKSTREIAEALFVSENTVKTHASRLFGKLDVNRRTQAVDVAKRLRIIP